MKQQQSQHHLGAPAQQQGANMTDFFKTQDPLSLLQTNFSDLTLNKDPQMVNLTRKRESECCTYILFGCGNFSRRWLLVFKTNLN